MLQQGSDINLYRKPEFFRLLSIAIGAIVVSVTMLALYGSISGTGLRWISVVRAPVAMGISVSAVALWLSCAAPTTTHRSVILMRRGAVFCASLTVLFGVLSLICNLSDVRWLQQQFGVIFYPIPALVAFGFIFIGAAIVMIDSSTKRGHFPSEYLALATASLMSIPLIGHLYDAAGLVQLASSTAVPLLTATLLTFLSVSIMTARPSHRLMRAWNSNAPGGHLLRELLPKSLLLLVLLDFLVEGGARRGLYDPQTISPLVVLLTIVWLTVLFWRAAALLNEEYDVRRKGEAVLSKTNSLLRAVSDNTPDPIYVKDRNGRMIFANPATLKMLRKDSNEVIGRHNREIYADAMEAQSVEASDQRVMEAAKVEMVEETISFTSGTKTFYSTKAPWINESGEILGLVGISIDITERKRMENALKAHETQLEALVAERTAEVSELLGHLESTREEEKQAIARELHDDLGSALTALNMHLAILFQQIPSDQRIADRCEQIKMLLSSITQTTRRIQAGLRPDKLDIFGIKTAISEQALEFENYSGVSCHASLPDEELSYTPQVEIALFRMVQEALNNIAKHAKAQHVDVVLDDNEENIILSIRDDGIGMPALQAGKNLTHGLRGMRERAAYLGGDVQIISAPNKGTKIVVTLPKLGMAAPQASAKSSEQEKQSA